MGSLRRSLFRSPVEKTGRKVQRELITGGFTLTLLLTGVRGRTAVRQTRSKRSVRENLSQPVDLCASVTIIFAFHPSCHFTLPRIIEDTEDKHDCF